MNVTVAALIITNTLFALTLMLTWCKKNKILGLTTRYAELACNYLEKIENDLSSGDQDEAIKSTKEIRYSMQRVFKLK